ncbi:MAG: hypothetical protein J5605_02490 [Bacteroidales bacterium]|nr:hypothetical protein [Bacteroidales bacterium]
MKKIIATLLIFSIFIGYSAKTNAKDDKKEVMHRTVYTKESGVYRLFLGVRYKIVETMHCIKKGTMVKKISHKIGGITKTYQISIEWNDCDHSEYCGTIVSTITDITKHMPYTSTGTTGNSALSH